MLAVIIQVLGFIGAIVALALRAPHGYFIAAFAVHFAGDVLFISEEGIPKMSFIDSLGSYVKLPAFLTFVGLMIAAGATFFFGAGYLRVIVFLGLGISLAGQLYEKIYN